jgi:hypothetical protein
MSLSASLIHPQVTFCEIPIVADNTLAEALVKSSTVPILDLSNCSALLDPIPFTIVSLTDDSTIGGGVDVAKDVG